MAAAMLTTPNAASVPLLAAHTDAEIEKGTNVSSKVTAEDHLLSAPKRLHAGLRKILSPYRRYIVAFQLALFALYFIGLAATVYNKHSDREVPSMVLAGLEKRTVLRGHGCEKQRKQLNVFMAAFFGPMFAADHFYARNWQLAVPKLIFFIIGFPGLAIFTAFTGVSLHFVWWLADVVMWGIGFYTTHTHWGNPTQGCAVIGW